MLLDDIVRGDEAMEQRVAFLCATCDLFQLLPLHDEMNRWNNPLAQPPWQAAKAVTLAAADAHDQTCRARAHPFEEKGPGHKRPSVWRRPAEHKELVRLEREQDKPVRDARQR